MSKTLSRQRQWQIKQHTKGLCQKCSKPVHRTGSDVCLEHLMYHRVREQDVRGWEPWRPGGLGRPPTEEVVRRVTEGGVSL